MLFCQGQTSRRSSRECRSRQCFSYRRVHSNGNSVLWGWGKRDCDLKWRTPCTELINKGVPNLLNFREVRPTLFDVPVKSIYVINDIIVSCIKTFGRLVGLELDPRLELESDSNDSPELLLRNNISQR